MPSSHCNPHPRFDPSSEEEIVITMRSQSANITATACVPRAIIEDKTGDALRSVCAILAAALSEELHKSQN